MNWKVKIEGDKQYLDDLNRVTEDLDFDTKIRKEDKKYFLEGKIFENVKDAKEVAEKAKTFLALVLEVRHFKPERTTESLKIIEIYDSENKRFFDSNGNLTREIMENGRINCCLAIDNMIHFTTIEEPYELLTESKEGTITGGLFTIESIVNYIDKNEVCRSPIRN